MIDSTDMRSSRGFSLAELVVTAVILIAVLTIVLIRISGSRESARRMECESNLRNVFLAMESYSLRHGHLPIGTQNPTAPIRSEPEGYHHNWATGLLPMLDHQSLYEEIDFQYGVYAPENAGLINADVPTLRCAASAETLRSEASSYAAVHSSTEKPIDSASDGMFLLGRPLSVDDAADGSSFVLLMGEKSIDFGLPVQWNSGTRASLRNAGHPINAVQQASAAADPLFVGGFSSNHIGGAYFLFVDGSFRFFADQTDRGVLKQLAGRDDAPPPTPTAEPENNVSAEPEGEVLPSTRQDSGS